MSTTSKGNTKHWFGKTARANNTTPEALVEEAIRQHGSAIRAAQYLGVSPTTVRHYLRKLGYQPITSGIEWAKPEGAQS